MSKDTDWEIVVQRAKDAQQKGHTWQSFVHGRNYRVRAIKEDRIEIERMDGGKDESLTRNEVTRAIEKLKVGPVRRGQLIGGIVAKECALIKLRRNISWDEHTDKISWNDRPKS